jgi:hypothetical protein
MTDPLPVAAFLLVIMLSACEQTLSGFGFALLVMPAATMLFGLPVAAPLIAVVALTLYAANFIRYRQGVDAKEAIRLIAASVAGIPAGLWMVANVSESMVKPLLGVTLVAFALYNLAPLPPLPVPSPRLAYVAGFLAGCLGGAYNTSGPPIIIYGAARQWERERFRGILQAFFLLSTMLTVTAHVIAQRRSGTILLVSAAALPALAVGVLLGWRLDPLINKQRFRVFVYVMILILGLSLIVGIGR